MKQELSACMSLRDAIPSLVPYGLGAILMTACSESAMDDGVGRSKQELFGNQVETRTAPWVRATAAVRVGGNCSGTLVAPDRVLTAAHCLCAVPATEVRFANDLGQLAFPDPNTGFPGDPAWPIINEAFNPRALVCGDPFVGSNDDDPLGHTPWDVAIVTIGISPQTGGLPTVPFFRPSTGRIDIVPVIKPILADPADARDAGRLASQADPTGSSPSPAWLAAGYGQNSPAEWSPIACVGCNTRRSGPVFKVHLNDDPCQHVLGIPAEFDCWSGNMWLAPSLIGQLSSPFFPNDPGGPGVELSSGDSGGGLFFTDTITGQQVLGGVHSNGRPPLDENDQRWAATGLSGDFLWDAMGLPPTLTVAQQRQGTAIFARNSVKINDRAMVTTGATTLPRMVSMSIGGAASQNQGNVRIGVEARVVGPLLARGEVTLADRSFVDDVTSGRRIFRGNGVTVAGRLLPAEWMKFEDFALSVPFQSGSNSLILEGNVTLAPGAYGDVQVHPRARVSLQSGSVYTFRSLNLDSNSTLIANNPVWIYIMTSAAVHLRGAVLQPGQSKASVLIGAPNAALVTIAANFQATLVAPRAFVSIDMIAFNEVIGSVFCNDFELHQGRILRYVPFQRSWVPACSAAFTGCQ